jgi:hypothetical protein
MRFLIFALVTTLTTAADRAPDRLVVKFRGDVAAAIEQVGLEDYAPSKVAPLFPRGEAAIDATRRRAERLSGRRLPDLNAYVEIDVASERSEALLRALLASPSVETAYRPALAPPPPTDIPPTTPNGEPDQGYLYAAPEGMEATYAWTKAGGRGSGIHVVDIEYSWRSTHEDLESTVGASACYPANSGDFIEHGTAAMGLLVAGSNGYGVTGLANLASPAFVSDAPAGMSYSVARAIDCATMLLAPGDVMLLEAQTYGPTGAYVPVEWDAAEYDAITIATAAGIVVVEPAGNGGENLDAAAYLGRFDRSVRDSGAVIVGAGAPPDYGTQPDRSRLALSSYGSRVDVQGWGDDVVTTGYGDAFDGDGDPNQYYTAVFSGTSSASAMVAGAVASLRGAQRACHATPMLPAYVRSLLASTGSPQVAGPFAGNIGTRPNLRAAIDALTVDQDGDHFTECGGDCTDADPTVWGVPGEVAGLRFLSKTALAWNAPAAPGTSRASRYQLARSAAKTMTAPACLLPDAWPGEQATDAAVPSVGGAFFYLVRAVTDCGEGPFGRDVALACPGTGASPP